MNPMPFMRAIVLIVSILALIKGLLLLVWPAVAARLLFWWVHLPARVLRGIGTLLSLLGLACIIAPMLTLGGIAAVVLLLGLLWLAAGVVYQKPGLLRWLARPWTAGSVVWLRVSGVLAVLLAVALLLLLYWR